jgi:hypothetical protein
MSRSTTTPPTPASSVRSPRRQGATGAGRGSLLLLAFALSACAGYGPGDLSAGGSEAELRASMGEPTGRYALPDGGSRLEYARGPMGKHTYMIDLDARGRVRGSEQVLTEANFLTIEPSMPQDQVRRKLGRASEARVGWRGVGEVWSYRFESPFCRWFQVWIVDGRVREAAYATDPMCEDRRRG